MPSVAPEAKLESTPAGATSRVGVTILELRYGLEERPGPVAAVLFGLQHVLVMFTAMVAAPLVIGQLLNLPADLRATMLTGVMFGCGIGTIISALGLGFIGARLPIVLGAFAVYIGPVVAMAKATSLAGASTAMLIGGLVLFAVSPLIGKMRAAVPAGRGWYAPYYHRHYTHSHRGQHRSRRQYALCRQSSGVRFDRWQHRADP